MPATSRVTIKASIVYLAVGAILGALLFVHRWLPLGPAVPVLKITHVHFLVVGWLTQLILGVGWWLFPPLKIGRERGAGPPRRRGQEQRGSEPLFWLTAILLNLGTLLRGLAPALYTWTRAEVFQVLGGLSGLVLLAAAIAFVINMWQRIRALGRDR
ncbi:MAG TPA: hypothetical protein VLC52_17225 [Anaerolineae bacterium]|nr:hypothetical protein [Anaerolineae bacterium]